MVSVRHFVRLYAEVPKMINGIRDKRRKAMISRHLIFIFLRKPIRESLNTFESFPVCFLKVSNENPLPLFFVEFLSLFSSYPTPAYVLRFKAKTKDAISLKKHFIYTDLNETQKAC